MRIVKPVRQRRLPARFISLSIARFLSRGLLCVSATGLTTGCGVSWSRARSEAMTRLGEWSYGGWLSDYQVAEERCRETGQPLLVLYKRPGSEDDQYRTVLAADLDAAAGSYVRCVLSSGVEPDRRYVAQFGIERAPAVIVRHADGTFHAKQGRFTAPNAADFVHSASAPGATPTMNPLIARKPRYAWFSSLRDAGILAADTQRPLLVAYERRLTRDFSELGSLLETTEVHRRVSDMVPCRVRVWNSWSDPHDGPFGMLHLPAIILVWPDGQSDILQRPLTSDAIVRFIDDARARFADRADRLSGAGANPAFSALVGP